MLVFCRLPFGTDGGQGVRRDVVAVVRRGSLGTKGVLQIEMRGRGGDGISLRVRLTKH